MFRKIFFVTEKCLFSRNKLLREK